MLRTLTTESQRSARFVATCAALVLLALACGCADRDHRFQQLSELANAEVRELPNPVDRLAKFLQLANLQAAHNQPATARAARDEARKILMQSDHESLKMEPRLAGWISLAELSREAKSLDESRVACGQAETLLHSLEPAQERVQYVQSLAHKFELTRGREAAVALYRRAAEWTVGMDDLKKRRGAFLAIAAGLVTLDQVDAAAEVVRRDEDRGWRAETFIALSSGRFELYGAHGSFAGRTPILGDIPAPEGASYSPVSGFSWKRLDFGSYFQNR